jgi:hypothetical protein
MRGAILPLPPNVFLAWHLITGQEFMGSRNSSVGFSDWLCAGRSVDRDSIPSGGGNFSLRHYVKTGAGAHSASYPMGTGGSFPGCIAAGA